MGYSRYSSLSRLNSPSFVSYLSKSCLWLAPQRINCLLLAYWLWFTSCGLLAVAYWLLYIKSNLATNVYSMQFCNSFAERKNMVLLFVEFNMWFHGNAIFVLSRQSFGPKLCVVWPRKMPASGWGSLWESSLVTHVCVPECSRNGFGMRRYLLVQEKFVYFRQSAQNAGLCLAELLG